MTVLLYLIAITCIATIGAIMRSLDHDEAAAMEAHEHTERTEGDR